jgi:MFS family permease
VAAVSNALFLLAGHFTIVMLGLLLSGLGFGLARPGFTTGASLAVEPHEQGAVAGILNAAGAAGFILGPFVGWLYELSPEIPYAFGAAMMLALLGFQHLSPVLRHAGEMPADPILAEETAETPLVGN